MRWLAVGLGLFASQANAQSVVFDPGIVSGCLTAGQGDACIGSAAQACMQATPGGGSTVGMSGCLDAELQWWDARLNRVYGALRKREAELDTQSAGPVARAEALRDMQRAWIPFRDAACLYAYSQWGGGTGGGPANLSCLLEETAAQTLRLEVYLMDWQ